MSIQDLDDDEKTAIWLAYERKCIWQGELVLSFEKHIDHIIPESVSAEDLEAIKHNYGLPIDFRVTDYRNLALSCSRCNTQKLARTATNLTPALLWQLQIAAEKAPKILELIQYFKSDKPKAKVKNLVTRAAKDKILDADDCEELIMHIRQTQQNLLTKPATATSIGIVSLPFKATSLVGTVNPTHAPSTNLSKSANKKEKAGVRKKKDHYAV